MLQAQADVQSFSVPATAGRSSLPSIITTSAANMDEEKVSFPALNSPYPESSSSSRRSFRMYSSASSSPRSSVGTWSPATPNFSHKFRNRVPTQMRRCIPIYVGCVLLILLVLNADLLAFSVSKGGNGVQRRANIQSHDGLVPSAQGFPKKVWQTWKTNPLEFAERDSTTAKTWLEKNPGFRYEVLTDLNDMGYVDFHFGPGGLNRPDIVDMYRNINATIIKADLLRYMIMYAEGGVYADIDVEALKPVSRFIPDHRYDENDIDMVIGIEIDQPAFSDHPILGKKSKSFCQWTFMARPRLPVMLRLIENIMAWLSDLAKEQNVSIPEVELDFDQVISGTGPSAFTEAIIAQMNLDSPKGSREITWDLFHDLDESKIVSRVLVLDVEAFAAGQGHSDSGNHDARGALVKHHYHASNWPSRHPRYQHPAYGPVEQCNWEPACVAKWDADTAAFALLNEEEQKLTIEFLEKEAKDLKDRQEAFLKALGEQERQQAAQQQQQQQQEQQGLLSPDQPAIALDAQKPFGAAGDAFPPQAAHPILAVAEPPVAKDAPAAVLGGQAPKPVEVVQPPTAPEAEAPAAPFDQPIPAAEAKEPAFAPAEADTPVAPVGDS